ncbi:hypothetical protein Ancab_013568 [Ancistrocladus abbreviatus]
MVIFVLVKAIKNPRSALCKTSIMASSDLFNAYGDQLLEPTASDAFDQLKTKGEKVFRMAHDLFKYNMLTSPKLLEELTEVQYKMNRMDSGPPEDKNPPKTISLRSSWLSASSPSRYVWSEDGFASATVVVNKNVESSKRIQVVLPVTPSIHLGFYVESEDHFASGTVVVKRNVQSHKIFRGMMDQSEWNIWSEHVKSSNGNNISESVDGVTARGGQGRLGTYEGLLYLGEYQQNDPELLVLKLLQLLLKASQDKRFVCEEAEKALNVMVQSLSPLPLLRKLQAYVSHSNLRVRAKAALSISNCVSKMKPEEFNEFGTVSLVQIAAELLNDKLPEAREAARSIVVAVYESFVGDPEDQKQESWQNFCQSNLPALHAQSIVKITIPRSSSHLGNSWYQLETACTPSKDK